MVLFMGFSCILLILPRVLLHFSLRFATFCLVFWCKIYCVLVHIAVRFGAKCVATSSD